MLWILNRICSWECRKHCGKRRKFLFLHCFQKSFLLGVVKSRNCVVKLKRKNVSIFNYVYRSSVTRMSVEQKHNMMKTDQDRLPVEGKMPPTKEEEQTKINSSSCSEEETSESDTGLLSLL